MDDRQLRRRAAPQVAEDLARRDANTNPEAVKPLDAAVLAGGYGASLEERISSLERQIIMVLDAHQGEGRAMRRMTDMRYGDMEDRINDFAEDAKSLLDDMAAKVQTRAESSFDERSSAPQL